MRNAPILPLPMGALLVIACVGAAPLGCGSDDASATATPHSSDSGTADGLPDALSSKDSGSILTDAPASEVLPDACVADSLKATLVKKPVDVIVVVDTSDSMKPASDAVETNINENLAAVLTAGNIDYRVIALAGYGGGAKLCVGPPLGGAPCTPSPPAMPANTSSFFHYSRATGSGGFLSSIVAWYSQADSLNLAPQGWSQWVRPDSLKVFIAFTDAASSSSWTGAQFDTQLLALQPAVFGTAAERNYVFHSIVGLKENNPPNDAWLPTDPVVAGTCSGYSGKLGAGKPFQDVSILSGGLRFPICRFANFDVVFKALADAVVEVAPIECDFPFPKPPPGKTIDPNTIQLLFTPGKGGMQQSWWQVAEPAKCSPSSFYVEGEIIHLCPEACAAIKNDSGAVMDVRYGCDTGFVK